MPTDPKKLTELKKPQREAIKDLELRKVVAIEEVADMLDCIRADLIGLQGYLGRVLK